MPYLSVWANGEEIDRVELSGGPVTVGRAPECELVIRDILLSRQHCRLEPVKNRSNHRWRLVDLGSRNGSHVHGKQVSNYVLVDGDTIRIGRTKLTFKTGPFETLPESPRRNKLIRPADPHEALSGTVADFVYVEHDDSSDEFDITPSPMSGESDGVKSAPGSSIDELAQSSWFGVQTVGTATATGRARTLARPMPRSHKEAVATIQHVGSRTSQTDLSLQVHESQAVPFLQVVPQTPAPHGRGRLVAAFILGAGVALATAAVTVTGWIFTH